MNSFNQPKSRSRSTEDYRSAQEIFDDCFSTVTTSTSTKTESNGTSTRQNSVETQTSSDLMERSSRPSLSRPTSQERKVRSLVLDTRYNRLLLVKSKMSEAEALRKSVTRTNSLPSSRRRSRFKWVLIFSLCLFHLAYTIDWLIE